MRFFSFSYHTKGKTKLEKCLSRLIQTPNVRSRWNRYSTSNLSTLYSVLFGHHSLEFFHCPSSASMGLNQLHKALCLETPGFYWISHKVQVCFQNPAFGSHSDHLHRAAEWDSKSQWGNTAQFNQLYYGGHLFHPQQHGEWPVFGTQYIYIWQSQATDTF